jgi:hypothetical protein
MDSSNILAIVLLVTEVNKLPVLALGCIPSSSLFNGCPGVHFLMGQSSKDCSECLILEFYMSMKLGILP